MERAHGPAGDAQLPRRDLKLKRRCVPSLVARSSVEGYDEGIQISPGNYKRHKWSKERGGVTQKSSLANIFASSQR